MVTVTLDLSAWERLERALRSGLGDAREPLRAAEVIARDEIQGVFEAQGWPEKWKPLTTDAILKRLRRKRKWRKKVEKYRDLVRSRRAASRYGAGLTGADRIAHIDRANKAIGRVTKSLGKMESEWLEGSHKILWDTGDMARSMTGPQGTKWARRVLGKSSVFIGTVCKYALTHQKGRGPVPARPFVVITDGMRRRVAETFRRWMIGLMRK